MPTSPSHVPSEMTTHEIEVAFETLKATADQMRTQQAIGCFDFQQLSAPALRIVRSNSTLPSVLTDGTYA